MAGNYIMEPIPHKRGDTFLLTCKTDVPAVNTGLAFKCEVRNGSVAAADNIECAKVYIESDY